MQQNITMGKFRQHTFLLVSFYPTYVVYFLTTLVIHVAAPIIIATFGVGYTSNFCEPFPLPIIQLSEHLTQLQEL